VLQRVMRTLAEKAAWLWTGIAVHEVRGRKNRHSPVCLWSYPQLTRRNSWKREVKKRCSITCWQVIPRFPVKKLLGWHWMRQWRAVYYLSFS